ncbi:hypothetical protein LY28_00524 [Ruminiclostridium sufflavum DSM 19573]|uniref:Lipoprotein n=1 Tax=Ruminiclostridium sufflavum DSM 19573 TaxID=1121337 RepID=A0A318XPW4_9FIRM|nr:hypothetical protein [Ruminiclostridium sufflavum]PYG89924.1 hypothetical protein LY28_00524 [Ruminiclostridium sufflavum DSM 19573]
MIKKLELISAIAILGIVFFMLAGCGADPIAEDITSYMNNQMPSVIELQNEYLSALNTISEAGGSDAKAVASELKDEVIPLSDRLIEAAEKVIPATEEIKALHGKYISAMTKQNSGLAKMLEGLQNNNEKAVTSGSQIISEANTEYTAFVNELTAIAKAHGLEVKK